MAITYKVDNAKKNKNLVGDEITLTKVKKTTGGAPEWFVAFEKKNEKHWEKQQEFNKAIIKRIDNIVKKNNLKE